MASRPVYIPVFEGMTFVNTSYVEFTWHPGMAVSQKQKSIDSLHSSAAKKLCVNNILEISSKSKDSLGVELSAFNLMINTIKQGKRFSVEQAYQSSKVFEKGGPYIDLLQKNSVEAKKDIRLKNSGRLLYFKFYGIEWDLQPQTAFYDWLYINALCKHPTYLDQLKKYDAFTDIEFNPEKSINCQAYSAALCVSLVRRNLINTALESKSDYLKIISGSFVNNARQNDEQIAFTFD